MKKIVLFAAVAIALGASSAGAAPTLCLPGPNGSGLALTDVTLDGVNATDCYGLVDANTNDISDAALKFGEVDAWGTANKSDLAAELAALWGLPKPVADLTVARAVYGTGPITKAILAEQQKIADTFFDLKLIPRRINVLEAAPAGIA